MAVFTLTLTDKVSPSPNTDAGRMLVANMDKLRHLGYTDQSAPQQNVSALNIPQNLLNDTTVFLVGSPANHDPYNQRLPGESDANHIKFKQEVFYSMCWATPKHSAVVMTFSQSACKKLEWWSVLQSYPTRTFMLAPAWFRTYRPRLGLADDMSELRKSDEVDTTVAIFAPTSFMSKLVWHGEQLDMAVTIREWLCNAGRLVTFGAYTAELEVDIASVPINCLQAGLSTFGSIKGDAP